MHPRSRSFAPRRAFAVAAAKAAGRVSRLVGREGAALPGVVALRIDPHLAGELSAQLDSSIVVAGTNGKTTTARFLGGLLKGSGFETVRNQSGSNLIRGIASTLVSKADFSGNLPDQKRRLGLFEVDEAALPEALSSLSPRTILLLNLFRDQLDRYGEVATIGRIWIAAFASVPPATSIVVNADDPLLVEATSKTSARVLYYSIQSTRAGGLTAEHASDVKACPRCGGSISYSVVYLGHLGHYACSNCDLRTPSASVIASEVELEGVEGSRFVLTVNGEREETSVKLPGMYNVYNALAAGAAASTFGLSARQIAESLPGTSPAFGRMERFEIEGRRVILALAKNPAGLNEVIRTVVQSGPDLHMMVMLNDRTADGRDVSWIWDADVELLAGRVQTVVFSGTRAEDMALRFKYAGVIARSGTGDWIIEHRTSEALQLAVKETPQGQVLFVIPTYTALLDIRRMLAKQRYLPAYWET